MHQYERLVKRIEELEKEIDDLHKEIDELKKKQTQQTIIKKNKIPFEAYLKETLTTNNTKWS